MTREDYHRLAEIVDRLMFSDPESHEERVWNMAIRTARGKILRTAVDTNAPWAEPTTTGHSVALPKAASGRRKR